MEGQTTLSNLRNNIRRLRFDHDEMTQAELAERAGCTRQTVIALEQGKYVPSITLAFRVARAFGVPLEAVFQYDNEDQARPTGS
jgi:putative transcriptional regulator